jgi:class 3 adenylate cyclase/tetratricopeptide (TPR) repeat protein
MAVCGSCGQENPPIAKFCLACGSPLAEPEAPSEERRLITAVFTDVVGSTATAESMDPEDVHQRLQPYFELVRQELQRYGGTLEKYIGDAVVAMFGAPVAHEDDPERAVRAALAIRDRIHDLNVSDDWLDLSIRIGVNTGEALLVMGSNPSLEYGMAAGDAINTAARIQSAAPVNGVMVGELTYQATRDVIEYEEAESIAAKGKSEPVPVWVATRALEVAERGRAVEGHLVGREAELEQLLDVWGAICRERVPGLAFVTGLPGIGKSGLLHEFAARIAPEGNAHWGGCLPYGEGITYWPVMEIVKDAAGILQTDDTSAVAAKLGALLESFGSDDIEELRTMAAAVSNLLGVATTPRGTYQAKQITQAELHWGIRRVLQLLARERPVALMLEDLHWAEPTLVELVVFLLEEQAGVPMLVLVSGRPEAADDNPGLVRAGERACTIRLEGLSDEGARALLRELLGSEELATAPAADTLLRTAGGNPLFLEETVAALRDAGMVDDEGWHLPDDTAELPTPTSLQGLIGSRLDQLARPEKRIAQNASVVGTVFWPGAVVHLQGDAAATQGTELVGKLRSLEQRDLVREHEISTVAGELEFAFKHILIRDVAYGQLPKGRRMELHMRFAEWVKALPTEEFIEIVAWHLERSCKLSDEVARTPVDPPIVEAVVALSAAAEKAKAREGWREAERYFARALELVQDDEELILELQVRRSGALIGLGKVKEALELALPTKEAARASGRLELAAEAIITLCHIAHRQGRAADAREHVTELQGLASQLGDPRLQLRARLMFASVNADMDGAFDEALEDLAKGVAIAEEINDLALLVEGHLRTGFILYNMARFEPAETEFKRCSALAAELGSTRDEARAGVPLAAITFLRGNIEEAELLGEQTREWLERTGETFFQIQNLMQLGQYALARGDPEAAEERLREALPLALDEESFLVAEIYRLLTEALVLMGRLEDAAELAEFASRGTGVDHPFTRAALAMAEAAVANAVGNRAAASKRYAEAIALLDELGWPVEVNQARIPYGRTLRDLGDLSAAREQFEIARVAFEEMGATGLLESVEEELELIGSGTG